MLKKTSFLRLFLFVFLALVITTAVVSIVIDPRGIFNAVDIKDFNNKKTSFIRSETFIKPHQVINSKSNIILLGDSRANTTFASSLDHKYFANQNVYSAGMAGQSIYADYRMLQHIQDMNVTHIIIFVDHLSFFSSSTLNQSIVSNNSDFSHRLNYHENGKKNYAQWLQNFKDMALLLCSFNTLQESLETIQQQNNAGWYLLQNGTWGGSFAYDEKSQRQYFDYIERTFLLEPLADIPDTRAFYESTSDINTFATLEKLIDLAHHLKARVEFIIPPVHARMFEVLFSMGRWQDYENWKRNFVLINEKIAKKQNSAPLTIWDFTAYNDFTTEKVPPFGDKSTYMRWFYDDVHVKPELGKIMLDEMVNHTQDNNVVTVLTSQSVEIQLEKLRKGHKAYLQQEPKETLQVYSLCLRIYKDNTRCVSPNIN
jgi:hypothetical protein